MSLSTKWLTYFALLGATSTACNGADFKQATTDESSPHQRQPQAIAEECLMTIRNYVDETRGWPSNAFMVIEEQSSPDARGFAVRHEDDANRLLPGGDLKSFHVDLTLSCEKVIRELAYQ